MPLNLSVQLALKSIRLIAPKMKSKLLEDLNAMVEDCTARFETLIFRKIEYYGGLNFA